MSRNVILASAMGLLCWSTGALACGTRHAGSSEALTRREDTRKTEATSPDKTKAVRRVFEALDTGKPAELRLPENARYDATGGVFI